jgi:type II secretory pathway component PulF
VKYLLRVFDSGGLVQTVCVEGDTLAGAAAVAQSRGLRVISIRRRHAQAARHRSRDAAGPEV